MSPNAVTSDNERKIESKVEAEALIPLFEFAKILNQDQSGRRITLLGKIHSEQALVTLERAAFPSSDTQITSFLASLSNVTNLGSNDVYRWYMGDRRPLPRLSSSTPHATTSSSPITTDPAVLATTTTTTGTNLDTESGSEQQVQAAPDLKINLIYPCSPTHIRKYTSQRLRYVTETPQVYHQYVKPWIERTQRTPARLDWMYNILDGITEQEDVIFRTPDGFGLSSPSSMVSDSDAIQTPALQVNTNTDKKGFILLPDLNWDRKTVESLHLLALVERRDLWSLRSLNTGDLTWLKKVRKTAVKEAAMWGARLAREGGTCQDQDQDQNAEVMEEDMLKCYVHYQPTYYHFHIHIVHVMLEAQGTTQSVGKAFSLDALIAQLESMAVKPATDTATPTTTTRTTKTTESPEENTGLGLGLDQIDLSYFVGEESDLWKKLFNKVKNGDDVELSCV